MSFEVKAYITLDGVPPLVVEVTLTLSKFSLPVCLSDLTFSVANQADPRNR
jgi:hypothetical protein